MTSIKKFNAITLPAVCLFTCWGITAIVWSQELSADQKKIDRQENTKSGKNPDTVANGQIYEAFHSLLFDHEVCATFPEKIYGYHGYGEPSGNDDNRYYDRENLKAQQVVACSTDRIYRLTLWQFLLSILGVIGLFVTIRQSRRATAITLAALEGEDRSSRQQLRAYLSVQGFRWLHADPFSLPRASYLICNSGSTPAFGLSINSKFLISSDDRGLENASTLNERETMGGYLAPGQSIEETFLLDRQFTEIERQNHNQGKQTIYLSVSITFQDAFGVKRCYCFTNSHRNVRTPISNSDGNIVESLSLIVGEVIAD
jgi:hypothetical protein